MKTKNKSRFSAGIAIVLLCIASIKTGLSQTTSEEWASLGNQYSANEWYFMAAEAFKKAAVLEDEDGNIENAEDYYWQAASAYADTAIIIIDNVEESLAERTYDDDPTNDALEVTEIQALKNAKIYLEASLSMGYEDSDFNEIKGNANNRLGDICEMIGQNQEAVNYYIAAAELFKEYIDYASDAAWAYMDAGEVLLTLKDFNNAYLYFSNAREYFAIDGSFLNESFSGLYSGYAKTRLAEYTEAADIYKESGDIAVFEDAHGNAGYAYDAAGHAIKYTDWSAAQNYWNKAKTNFTKEGMGYEIPPDFQVEIDTPHTAHSLWAEFLTEIDTFEQGKAIKVAGKILFEGKPTAPNDDKKIYLELIIPNCSAPKNGRQLLVDTDENGLFSLYPFAGWNIGDYSVVISSENKYLSSSQLASDTCKLIVKKATLGKDISSKIENIIDYYFENIPEGPIRNGDVYVKYIVPYHEIIEQYILPVTSTYGTYQNLLLAGSEVDPHSDFTCAGYQNQILTFFNKIRFNEKKEIRELMDGLDFVPIAIGPEITPTSPDESVFRHVAVALYPIGTDWKSDSQSKVLDPWFKQKPMVYGLDEWEVLWQKARVDELHINATETNKGFSGYPSTGGVIFVNYNNANCQPYKSSQIANKIKAFIKCPVNVLITNSKGENAGITSAENYIQEFSVFLVRTEYDIGKFAWYFEMPKGDYTINITGINDGEFDVFLVTDSTQDSPFVYGTQSILKDSTATIHIGTQNQVPDLILPDGTIVKPDSEQTDVNTKLITSNNKMYQNNPNPFYVSTEISYVLSRNMHARMEVFDIAGRCVKTLVNSYKSNGFHTVQWDGCGESGNKLQSGIYFYRLTTDNWTSTKKMYLVNK